jgi:hypothetical protein
MIPGKVMLVDKLHVMPTSDHGSHPDSGTWVRQINNLSQVDDLQLIG